MSETIKEYGDITLTGGLTADPIYAVYYASETTMTDEFPLFKTYKEANKKAFELLDDGFVDIEIYKLDWKMVQAI